MKITLICSVNLIILLAFLIILPSKAKPKAQYQTTLIEVPGSTSVSPMAINDRGDVVGSVTTKRGVEIAFVWSNGHATKLNTFYTSSRATAINNKRQIVGYCFVHGFQTHACLWDKGHFQDLGTLGGESSQANAINDKGQIVGWSDIQGNACHAFVWNNGHMQDLKTFGGKNSSAESINENGDIVGWSHPSPEKYYNIGMLISRGGRKISFLHGQDRILPHGVNKSGEIAGEFYSSNIGYHVFNYSKGVFQDIGTLYGGDAYANSINNQGFIVGTSWHYNELYHAFIYNGINMIDINAIVDSKNIIVSATGINNSNWIIGSESVEKKDKAILLTPITNSQ